MASNILLSDTFLNWIEPNRVLGLKSINREFRAKAYDFAETKTSYTIQEGKYSEAFQIRKTYASYPNIKKLTIPIGRMHRVSDYLRPTTKSLHLILELWLGEKPYSYSDVDMYSFSTIMTAFQELQEFLLLNPNAQLEELKISFSDTVFMTYNYPRGVISHYDRNGPVYEDYDKTIEINNIEPSLFIYVIDREIKDRLQRAVVSIVEKNPRLRITIPYHFPGAIEIPNLTYSDVFQLEEDDITFIENCIYHLKDSN